MLNDYVLFEEEWQNEHERDLVKCTSNQQNDGAIVEERERRRRMYTLWQKQHERLYSQLNTENAYHQIQQ